MAEYVYEVNYGNGTAEFGHKEEIVRCKDCKYWNGMTHGCNRNPCVERWEKTDFCNYGERG